MPVLLRLDLVHRRHSQEIKALPHDNSCCFTQQQPRRLLLVPNNLRNSTHFIDAGLLLCWTNAGIRLHLMALICDSVCNSHEAILQNPQHAPHMMTEAYMTFSVEAIELL